MIMLRVIDQVDDHLTSPFHLHRSKLEYRVGAKILVEESSRKTPFVTITRECKGDRGPAKSDCPSDWLNDIDCIGTHCWTVAKYGRSE
jgi:hypothetical protein